MRAFQDAKRESYCGRAAPTPAAVGEALPKAPAPAASEGLFDAPPPEDAPESAVDVPMPEEPFAAEAAGCEDWPNENAGIAVRGIAV